MRTLLAAFLLLLSQTQARAARARVSAGGNFSKTGYDELAFLGWNNGCSCALQYQSYPPLGHAMQNVPDGWKFGFLTLAAESREVSEKWLYRSRSGYAWEPERAEAALGDIQRMGYGSKGYVETVRPVSTARPDLEQTLRSPAALASGQEVSWPKAPYVLRQIFYSPLAVCALVVFKNEAAPLDSFRWKLIRLLEPGVRRTRGRAHLENGLLFYDNADVYSALDETMIAASMLPEVSSVRYNNARVLATQGRFDDCLAELDAAIRLEPGLKAAAREAIEFRSLENDLRFKALVR